MTKNSIKKYFEIIQEASEKETAEASSITEVITEEKPLPSEPVIINQEDFNEILAEKDDQEQTIKKLRTQQLQNKISEDSDLHGIRKSYTGKLFILTLSWLTVVTVLVFLTGLRTPIFNNPQCGQECYGYILSENILIAFITSTTATVIGIFIIVAKWLFPSPPNDEKKGK